MIKNKSYLYKNFALFVRISSKYISFHSNICTRVQTSSASKFTNFKNGAERETLPLDKNTFPRALRGNKFPLLLIAIGR